MSRDLSSKGLNLIKSFEGCKLTAYKCLPTEKYYTIGYGHYGSDVKAGMKITEEQAEELLLQDCKKAIKNVNSFMSKYNFNQNQFDALVSFTYNLGGSNLKSSTLLKKVNANPCDRTIADEFKKWVNAGGKKLNGLVKRRKSESELYFKY